MIFPLAIAVVVGCSTRPAPPERPAAPDAPPQYFSDYFVFVGADPTSPLIVPIDINWEPRPDGQIYTELKAWRGTESDWPMRYHTGTAALPAGAPFPTQWSDVPATAGFGFAPGQLRITGEEVGSLELPVPSEGMRYARTPEPGMSITYEVSRTTLQDAGRVVPGWLIHERVELDRLVKVEGLGPMFGRYHWIPVVTPDALYLFNHDDQRPNKAVRWQLEGDAPRVDAVDAFQFEVTATEADAGSGRSAVPTGWTIGVESWSFSATFTAKAGHTGYGPDRDHGKALYRQATLVGTDGQGRPAVGMLELILED